jgi:hypothetical protein
MESIPEGMDDLRAESIFGNVRLARSAAAAIHTDHRGGTPS